MTERDAAYQTLLDTAEQLRLVARSYQAQAETAEAALAELREQITLAVSDGQSVPPRTLLKRLASFTALAASPQPTEHPRA